jgi:hypothetical protein
MPQKTNLSDQAVIKFFLPFELKEGLERVARERGLSVAALVRLILSDYIKSKK